MSGRRLAHADLRTQVNVIAPVLLSLLLVPTLKRLSAAVTPRIVFTGSHVAEIAPAKSLRPADPLAGLDDPKAFKSSDRYNESKVRKAVADIALKSARPPCRDSRHDRPLPRGHFRGRRSRLGQFSAFSRGWRCSNHGENDWSLSRGRCSAYVDRNDKPNDQVHRRER